MQYSFKAIDVGFELRRPQMPVCLPADTTEAVWDGGEAQGGLEAVALAMDQAGFKVVAAVTSRGREARVRGGRFESQPPLDNYWKSFATLAEALAFAEATQ